MNPTCLRTKTDPSLAITFRIPDTGASFGFYAMIGNDPKGQRFWSVEFAFVCRLEVALIFA